MFTHPIGFLEYSLYLGPPFPVGNALVRLCHSLARVKIWVVAPPRGRNMVFRKSRFRWAWSHIEICVVSGSKFTGPFSLSLEKSRSIAHWSDFGYLHPFRRYSPSNFEVVRNWAKFCMFLAPKIFGSAPPPKFCTGIIKLNIFSSTVQNVVAIGRAARRSCGEKNKKRQQNISPLQKLSLPGGLITRDCGFRLEVRRGEWWLVWYLLNAVTGNEVGWI